MQKFLRFFNRSIAWFGIIFAAIISLVSLLLTTNIVEYGQKPMTIDFAPYIVICVILFTFLLATPPIFRKLKTIKTSSLLHFTFVWTVLIAFLWILIADVSPMWDSKDLVIAATAINGNRDPTAIGKWIGNGSYLERFPYQAPLVSFLALLMQLFGSNYLLVFQILNCIAAGLIVYFIIKLSYAYFHHQLATNLTAILCLLFLPLIFYCTFIYGNTISLAFVFSSWFFQHRALTHSSRKACNAILSIIFMVVAVVFKQTLIIAAITSALVWLFSALKHQKTLIIVAVLEITLAYFTTPIINLIAEKLYPSINLHNGEPQTAWIAMGIGASKEYFADINHDETYRNLANTNSGYYDGFVWELNNEKYSKNAMSDLNHSYIRKRLEHYQSDPALLIKFFSNKLVVEWTEPTFESLLASNWCISDNSSDYRMCDRNYTLLAPKVYYGKFNHFLLILMDTIQAIIPLGLLIALFEYRKKLSISQMAPLICLLGGAFLYIFWESKTQYNLMFFLMMLPYAGFGWSYIAQRLSSSRLISFIFRHQTQA